MEPVSQVGAHEQPPEEHRPAEGLSEAYDDAEAAHDEPTHDEPVGRRERETFGLQIPLARIKRAMKDATDVKAVSAEASYLVARATELLLEHLTFCSAEHMQAAQRADLLYRDVAASVKQWPAAKFLSDIVPQQVTIASLMQQVQREDALDLANGVSHSPLDAEAMQEDALLNAAPEPPGELQDGAGAAGAAPQHGGRDVVMAEASPQAAPVQMY
ncbi:hypothetical protein WJX81_000708 [Elliptochloris bilobata]|uniref:Transcription factor CBF/NF-Y/archaeal histone domain-containing protein n=1 Tax=Elliptochloris bilobata TaxID=381761 RepID=A0AAW1S8L6_9CHLO